MFAFVTAQTGKSADEIKSSRRDHEVCFARFKVCYILSKIKLLSMPQIGRILGGRDHTTVLNGIRRAEQMICQGLWVPPTKDALYAWSFAMQRREIG